MVDQNKNITLIQNTLGTFGQNIHEQRLFLGCLTLYWFTFALSSVCGWNSKQAGGSSIYFHTELPCRHSPHSMAKIIQATPWVKTGGKSDLFHIFASNSLCSHSGQLVSGWIEIPVLIIFTSHKVHIKSSIAHFDS